MINETNILYRLIVEVCLRIRRNRGLSQLSTISMLNAESMGDVLEGIVGMACAYHPHLLPPHVDHIRRNVVAATDAVKGIWNSPTYRYENNIEVLVNRILLADWNLNVRVTPSGHEIQLHRRHIAKVTWRYWRSVWLRWLSDKLPSPVVLLVRIFIGQD